MRVPGTVPLAVCGLHWPAAVVGLGWTLDLMWVVSSKDPTQYLIELIREARSSKAPTRKWYRHETVLQRHCQGRD